MKLKFKIQDPSGGLRTENLDFNPNLGSLLIGRGPHCEVQLKDPTLAPEAALLTLREGNLWIETIASPFTMGDFEVSKAKVVEGVPIRLGESEFCLEPKTRDTRSLPLFPSNSKPWLTRSDTGLDLLWMAKKSAGTPLSLYLAGETGTGKEVLAGLIHAWSSRAHGPFVPLHCGALPLSLAESELFGHVKGAFTGANQNRVGALMQAHGGTLFLDEVGDLPLDIQVKLLRFLENGEIRPVGSDRSVTANARIVCATHHPLAKLVEEGKFRRDLYYRLASVTLEIPTLRSRPEDIEMLAQKYAQDLGKSLSPKARLKLLSHPWSGNVRELRHAVERAAGLSGPFESVLNAEAFEFLSAEGAQERDANKSESPDTTPLLTLKEMERMLLLKALKLSQGNRGVAAKHLGIARSTIFEMLKRHRIVGPKRGMELLSA